MVHASTSLFVPVPSTRSALVCCASSLKASSLSNNAAISSSGRLGLDGEDVDVAELKYEPDGVDDVVYQINFVNIG